MQSRCKRCTITWPFPGYIVVKVAGTESVFPIEVVKLLLDLEHKNALIAKEHSFYINFKGLIIRDDNFWFEIKGVKSYSFKTAQLSKLLRGGPKNS